MGKCKSGEVIEGVHFNCRVDRGGVGVDVAVDDKRPIMAARGGSLAQVSDHGCVDRRNWHDSLSGMDSCDLANSAPTGCA